MTKKKKLASRILVEVCVYKVIDRYGSLYFNVKHIEHTQAVCYTKKNEKIFIFFLFLNPSSLNMFTSLSAASLVPFWTILFV